MWADSPRQLTAEWQCTRCDATNRRLLPLRSRQGKDVCVHCHLKHRITKGDTPVRWMAQAG